MRFGERDLAEFGITRVENHGPYLNFHLARGDVAARVIDRVLREGAHYGTGGTGAGKRALVEHTSINPNASPHLGRARNAWIGDTLVRLLRFEGYDLEVRFFVNDVGRQIALLVLRGRRPRTGFHELLQIYVDINRRLEAEPDLAAQVTQRLERLESGDAEVRAAFRRVVEISVRGMREVFADADVRYDSFDYESDYLTPERSQQLVEQLRTTGRLFEDEHGRLVLNLEGFELPSRNPVLVITRGNKTSLYVLRDMAYTLDKVAAAADLNLVVLGEDQKLYHRQLQAALSLLGCAAPAAVHYSFVLLGEGSMSSRQGNLVLLEDFVAEAKRKAAAELQARGHEATRRSPRRWRTAPSSTRSCAWPTTSRWCSTGTRRCRSRARAVLPAVQPCPHLLHPAQVCKELPTDADYSVLEAAPEAALIKLLDELPDQVARALRVRSPHVIAGYTFAVARQFSTFYHACPILQADSPLREARLLLAAATRQVLANCLGVLGIEALQRM